MSDKPTKKKESTKRKYSRGGCNECKRRKIKCDEQKPHCHNCTRLSKQCSYETIRKIRFKYDNNLTTSSNAESQPDIKDSVSGSLPFEYNRDKYKSNQIESSVRFEKWTPTPPPQQDPNDNNDKNLPETYPATVSSENDLLSNTSPWDDNISLGDVKNLFDDANHLIHDSLDLFDFQITGDSIPELQHVSKQMNVIPFLKDDTHPPDKASEIVADTATSNKKLISKTLGPLGLDGVAEVTYLNDLTETELGYHYFPFAVSIESNPVIGILLRYLRNCPYLLTALLASSATFQFIRTGIQKHEKSRSQYTSVCLKSLSEAFTKQKDSDDEKYFSKDIEKLLLTILTLTSMFTATTYLQKEEPNSVHSSWKTHLRGVKELLLHYSRLSSQKSSARRSISDGLALAKIWFFLIESIAELNDPRGGTLKYIKKNQDTSIDIIKPDPGIDSSDMSKLWLETGYFTRDRNPEYHDALVRIGLLTDPKTLPISTQFNMLTGYSIRVVELIDEIAKSLDLLRVHPGSQLSSSVIIKIMSLVENGRTHDIVPGVCQETFEIPVSSKAHPEYQGHDRIELPSSCYAKDVYPGGVRYFSWFDLSEQLLIDEMYLKLLTTNGLLKLPKTHPLIIELKDKIFKSMFFLKDKTDENYSLKVKQGTILIESENYYLCNNLFDVRAIMVPSPYIQCSLVVSDEQEFEKLELYFLGLVKLGNGSSLFALDRLYRLRERIRNNQQEDTVEEEGEDIDTYRVIPFS